MNFEDDEFLRIAKLYEDETKRKPFFLSDWDADYDKLLFPKTIINQSLSKAKLSYATYAFSEDQAELKRIYQKFAQKNYQLKLEEDEICLTTNSTSAIFQVLNTLSLNFIKSYLIITPIYYSVVDTLQQLNCKVTFYHLTDTQNFSIDLLELEKLLISTKSEALIFTDPIYCVGSAISAIEYERIVEIANKHNVWLICDHTLGGLEWNNSYPNTPLPDRKIKAIKASSKHIFIDSITKRLLINGIKHAVIITNSKIVPFIEDFACQVIGGFCNLQIELFKEIFNPLNEKVINKVLASHSQKIQRHFNLLQSALIGTEYYLHLANSGYFAIILHKTALMEEIDESKFVKNALYKNNLHLLPLSYFNFYTRNHFGIRVNLLKDISFYLPLLIDSLSEDLYVFQKTS